MAWIPTDRDILQEQQPLTAPFSAPVTSNAPEAEVAPDTGGGLMNFMSDSANANSDGADPISAVVGDPPIPLNNDDVPSIPTSPKAPADAKA